MIVSRPCALCGMDLVRPPRAVTVCHGCREGVRVQAPELRLLLLYTMRYALGRRTTAPADACAAVYRHHRACWDDQLRLQAADEIRQALDSDRAGDQCDRREWESLEARLRWEVEHRPEGQGT
jgi:hypothetical protein